MMDIIKRWINLNREPIERPYILSSLKRARVKDPYDENVADCCILALMNPRTVEKYLDEGRIETLLPTHCIGADGKRVPEPSNAAIPRFPLLMLYVGLSHPLVFDFRCSYESLFTRLVHSAKKPRKPHPRFMGEVCHVINRVIRLFNRDSARLQRSIEIEKENAPGHKLKSPKTVQMSFQDHNLRHPSEIYSLLWYLRESIIYKWGGYNMRPTKQIAILSPAHWHVSFANKEEGKEKWTPVSRANPDFSRLIG